MAKNGLSPTSYSQQVSCSLAEYLDEVIDKKVTAILFSLVENKISHEGITTPKTLRFEKKIILLFFSR